MSTEKEQREALAEATYEPELDTYGPMEDCDRSALCELPRGHHYGCVTRQQKTAAGSMSTWRPTQETDPG